MLKVKLNTKVRISIIAILSIILTIMVIIIMVKRGIPMIWDTKFHIGRIYDIREAFKAHRFPTWINFSSYFGMGQAVNGMYPDITLWPFVFITNSLSFVDQIIAIKVLILISTFLVTYISLLKHKFIKENSFYIAILYTFSGYSLYQFLYELQPGAIIIYIFTFPLIFSIEKVLYVGSINKRLIIKLSLLFGIALYSHLLSAVVIAFLIIILWFVRIILEKELNYYSILNLFFASILTFFYSMPVLYRIYTISKSGIAPPCGKGIVDSENLIDIFTNPSVYARITLSFVALVLLILSLHYFGKNSEISKLLVAEMVIIILCSNLIPWNFLGKLPLIDMLQFTPWRFGIYLSALPMLAFLYTKINNKNMILFVLALLSLIAIPECLKQNSSIFATSQCTFLNNKNIKENNHDRNFDFTIRDYLPTKIIGSSVNNDVPQFIKDQSMCPKIEGEKHQKIKIKKIVKNYGNISLYNQESIKKENIVIPIYYYSSLNYHVYVNGSKVSKITESNHGFMQFKLNRSLQKNSEIIIRYNNPKLYNILLGISIALYLIMTIILIRLTKIKIK